MEVTEEIPEEEYNQLVLEAKEQNPDNEELQVKTFHLFILFYF